MAKNTHHLTVGICGAFLGVMLGAGTLLQSQTLAASVEGGVAFRGINSVLERAYRRRGTSVIDEKRGSGNAEMEADDEEGTDDSAATMPSMADCGVKVRVTDEIQAIVMRLVPQRPDTNQTRALLDIALKDYAAACRAHILSTMPATESAPTQNVPAVRKRSPKVDCSQFTGSRMTKCLNATEQGINYDGTER